MGFAIVAHAQFVPATKPTTLQRYPNAARAEFGYVSVPENRSDSGSNTIQVAVLIVHAKNGAGLADPVFYFVGGPGGSATLSSYGFPVFETLNQTRDLVFVDPRGAGFSKPNLYMRRGGFTIGEFVSNNRNYFESQGIDLSGYNTSETVQDFDAVRQALGYSQINIFANSYGTFIAQEMIRRFPATIRALVMSGNSPAPDSFLPTTLKFEEDGILELLKDVRRDRISRKAYPKLRKRFFALVDTLNAHPVRLALINQSTGRSERVTIDGGEFISTITGLLQSTRTLRLIPMLVAQMEQKRYNGLTRRFFAPFDSLQIEDPFGQYLSVLGTDFAAPGYVKATKRGNAMAKTPALVAIEAPGILQLAQIIVAWGVPYNPGTTRQYPTGNVPTLLLDGQMDAQTPVNGGAHIAAHLSNATDYVYPRVGHGVGFDPGPDMNAAIAFINDPTTVPPYTTGNLRRPGFYKGRVPKEPTRGIDDWKAYLVDRPAGLRK